MNISHGTADEYSTPVMSILSPSPLSALLLGASLLALPGCQTPLNLILDESIHPLPRFTPGILLLGQLWVDAEGTGSISIHQAITEQMYFDVDQEVAEDQAFEYELLDESGTPLYRNGIPGPVQVSEYMASYLSSAGLGSDAVFQLFPQIGWFPLMIPFLPEAVQVEFYLRDEASDPVLAGSLALGDLDAITVTDLSEILAQPSEENQLCGNSGIPSPLEFEEIWHSGPSEKRLDIAILGDGYTENQMGRFRQEADEAAEEILSREPFHTYAEAINLWRVDTPSVDEGASYDCSALVGCSNECRDTALRSMFAISMINEFFGTQYSDRMVFQLDQWNVARVAAQVPFDTALVLVNSDKYGGFAVYYGTFTNGEQGFAQVGSHEMGHSFGFLGDEYVSDQCIRTEKLPLPPNISEWSDGNPHWSNWIDSETPLPTPAQGADRDTVGMYQGAFNCQELYRPSVTCKMESNFGDYCSVCREHLVKRIYDFVDPLESTEAEVIPRWNGWEIGVHTLHSAMKTEWRLDGVVVQETDTVSSLFLPSSLVSPGEHVLTATVTDSTSWVKGADPGMKDSVWWRFTR